MVANGDSREEILKRRAERLAALMSDEKPRRIALQVAIVGTGGQRFGITVDALREIVVLPAITTLPGLPRWLLGITHVRGELIGVVNLAEALGANTTELKAMAIVNGSGGLLGLAVESVLGFRDIAEDELTEPMRFDAQSPIRSLTKDFITIIDVKKLPNAVDAAAMQLSGS